MYCPKCGGPTDNKTNRCLNCGFEIPESQNVKEGKAFFITMMIVSGIIALGILVMTLMYFLPDFISSKPTNSVSFSQTHKSHDVVNKENKGETETKKAIVETESPETDEAIETASDADKDYYRCYVWKSDAYDSVYYPALELYDDGTFVFTENLLSGMGKFFGSYEEDKSSLTAYVDSIDFPDAMAGAGIKTISFTKSATQLKINDSLCSTPKGSVFVRDDTFDVSESFLFDIDEPDDDMNGYSYMFEDREVPDYTFEPLSGTVCADGGLNIRKGPGTDREKVILIPDGSYIFIYGATYDNSWFFVEYDGNYGWSSGDYINVNY